MVSIFRRLAATNEAAERKGFPVMRNQPLRVVDGEDS